MTPFSTRQILKRDPSFFLFIFLKKNEESSTREANIKAFQEERRPPGGVALQRSSSKGMGGGGVGKKPLNTS